VLEQREALAEARAKKDLDRVHALGEDMRARAKGAEQRLAAGFAGAADRTAVERLLPLLGELRFYRRFLDEVEAIEEEALG
jgi:molecular chaperone HscB